MMPPGGAPARAETVATVQKISHEMFVSDETGRLIEAAAARSRWCPARFRRSIAGPGDQSSMGQGAARARAARRRPRARRARSVTRPGCLAREASDFAAFVPYLERNFELVRRYVDCFDNFDCAYDVLLDDYEPGGRTSEVARLFDELKAELRPMIAEVERHRDRVDDSLLYGDFPVDRQRQLVAWLLEQMGFDRSAWRIDDAVHPFATGFSNHDVRITTRWDESFLLDLDVRRDARVRSRSVRGGRRAVAAAHAARPRGVAGPARVSEPAVGEHGRPRPAVLRRARAADRGPVRGPAVRARRRHAFTALSTASRPR